MERLSATRVASAACSLSLLRPNQCRSLAGFKWFNALTTVTHEVSLLQVASLKLSTFFQHVSGVFDNICSNKLDGSLAKAGVSIYLLVWINSFLSRPQCWVIFKGAPKVFCPVADGTPHGSLISPSPFVPYIASLHMIIPHGLAIFYVDDRTLTGSSDSEYLNIRALRYLFNITQRQGAGLGVPFSVPKT